MSDAFTGDWGHDALHAAELLSDGRLSRDDMMSVYEAAKKQDWYAIWHAITCDTDYDDAPPDDAPKIAEFIMLDTIWGAMRSSDLPIHIVLQVGTWVLEFQELDRHSPEAAQLQCGVLREICNPFEKSPIEKFDFPPEALSLAEEIYDNRAFQRLSELGDLLDSGGYDHKGVIEHCRANVSHVLGCWALDLALEKS